MKRIWLVLFLAGINAGLTGQADKGKIHPIRDCEAYPGLIDSLYAFTHDTINDTWKLVTIRHYDSSEGKYNRILYLDAKTRNPIRKWDYSYDERGNRNLEISSTWINNSWLVTFKKESDFDPDNRKLSELRQNLKSNTWIFREYYYYEYAGDRLDKVHYQIKDANGILYDRDFSVYVYSGDQLIEVIGYDGLTGAIKTADLNYYDTKTGRLSEVISYTYEQDQTGEGFFIPVKRIQFIYDEFNLMREELFQEMKDGDWVSYQKYIVYRKLYTSKKVLLCHNGHTICVSVNALKAHLDHGDKFGSCASDTILDRRNPGSENNNLIKAPFTIFPNPARDILTVRFDNSINHGICRIILADTYGKPLRTYDTEDKGEIIINRGNLKHGQYFLRFTGKGEYSAVIIFR
ncbi:MAG: T9SS type A sorting domain-containing protein [Bacteroidales bacterium]|nr:T9SS type A sorting domain-containing protein [Bacteroidales bacterium]